MTARKAQRMDEMKRVSDYTEAELLAFDDGQLNKLIEIECMVEGVEAVEPPGIEPTFGGDLQTKNYYTLENQILFPSIESANEASKLATHVREYSQLNGKYLAKLKKGDNVQVDTFYDYAEVSEIKADKESFDKLHEQWARRNSAYNSYCNLRNKAESAVYDAINSARETIGEENKRLAQYNRYLELAEDPEIAGRFFLDMLKKQGWGEEESKKELERVSAVKKATEE
jgi:hypothetical protein